MTIRLEDQIGDIVAQNYRTASIFKAKGIDFCCRGHRSLRDVINEKGLVAEDVLKELASTEVLPGSTPPDYAKWRLEYLIDHIISQHHAYIRRQVPVIKAYLDKVFNAHGQTEPVFGEIRTLFAEDARDLLQHLESEEEMVFPMIRDIAVTPLHTAAPSCVPLNFFQQMISMMEQDHVKEGDRWKKMSELTQHYTQPVGCNTVFVTLNLLKEFYDDLLLHIHLENNILFPGALELKNNKIKALLS